MCIRDRRWRRRRRGRNRASCASLGTYSWTRPVQSLLGRQSQLCHQVRDQRNVRRWHFVIPQPVRFYPGELLPLRFSDLPLPVPANIERHQEMKVGIGVTCESERRETGLIDDDAQFLLQLLSLIHISEPTRLG